MTQASEVMITMMQIFCHMLGDFLVQSDWNNSGKTKHTQSVLMHCLSYSLPFVFLIDRYRFFAIGVVAISHYLIDRYQLVHVIVGLTPEASPILLQRPIPQLWYPAETPYWLVAWFFVIIETVLNVSINGIAFHYL